MSVEATLDRAAVLARAPLFADRDPAELRAAAARCTERAYRKGEGVWRAGDRGEELLIVESGELAVWGTDESGADELLARLGPGECVGEMALLVDDWRCATVTCTRSARVLALNQTDFRQVVASDAGTMSRVSEMLSRRAASAARRAPIHRQTTIVTVVAEPGMKGASLVAAAVAALQAERLSDTVMLVRLGDDGPCCSEVEASAVHPTTRTNAVTVIDVSAEEPQGDAVVSALDRFTSTLVGMAPVVVVDVHGSSIDVTGASMFSDVVIDIAAAADAPEMPTHGDTSVLRVVNLYNAGSHPFPVNQSQPLALPIDAALDGAPVERQIGHVLEAGSSPVGIALRRLAHKTLGVSVGVALGGGAALGIAHIGVLQALEDAGIPVDMVAGASMGSVIAVGYAAGLTPEVMLDMARRVGTVRTTLSVLDPTLAGTGLLAGKRMRKILAPLLPSHVDTFDDLVRPCRVLATDVETGERVTIGDGRLEPAVRASCAIPVIFTPVRHQGRTLIDGAFVDPVPADVVAEMGADVIIGVNVVPPLERGASNPVSRAFHGINRLNPFSYLYGTQGAPNLVDVLMNTLQIVEYELGTYKSRSADVSLAVDLAGFTWIEFYRGPELVARGREAGERVLPEVRRVIDRRMAAYARTPA